LLQFPVDSRTLLRGERSMEFHAWLPAPFPNL
jgi:hypothetical protein